MALSDIVKIEITPLRLVDNMENRRGFGEVSYRKPVVSSGVLDIVKSSESLATLENRGYISIAPEMLVNVREIYSDGFVSKNYRALDLEESDIKELFEPYFGKYFGNCSFQEIGKYPRMFQKEEFNEIKDEFEQSENLSLFEQSKPQLFKYSNQLNKANLSEQNSKAIISFLKIGEPIPGKYLKPRN